MARTPSRPRPASRARRVDTSLSPRTVFLASLGAAILVRRQAGQLATDVASVPDRLRAGADAAVATAKAEARKFTKSAKARVAPIQREMDKLGAKVESARVQGVAETAKRLNPILARVGLPAIPVARATPKKRTAKKAVKSATSRRPAVKKAAARRRA